MKVLIVLVAAVFAVASAAPVDDAIVKYNYDNGGLNEYSFDVETSAGNKHQESGSLHPAGGEVDSLAVKGVFSFVGPDQKTYEVNYVADENGFQPTGDHLPVSHSSRYFPVDENFTG